LIASVQTPPTGGEALDLGDAVETILAAPPAPLVPAVLFTSDKLDLAAAPSRRAELLGAHDRLAAQLGAQHVTDTASGHHIHVERPQLISDAIRDVVTQASTAHQVQALIPDLESYIANNMKDFDVPGLAIGIVSGDRLVYAKGFGIRSEDGDPVDTETVFQIASTSKQFLAGTLAIAVDEGKLNWDDRVTDLDPDFQLHDPWVTREFRVFDLLAQRSGLPPYANDSLALLGLDRSALVRSLRYVAPASSFRSSFAYTNITHILAGRILARVQEAADWSAVLQGEILDPLGMKDTSIRAGAIVAAANHAEGFRFTPDGSIMVPFSELIPYGFDGAGAINSNIADMSKWVSLQLAGGTTPDGRRIISSEGLVPTHRRSRSTTACRTRLGGSRYGRRTGTFCGTMAELPASGPWSSSSSIASSASSSFPIRRMSACPTRLASGPWTGSWETR
jgi:CubicO group peptidase (beta-lactamase class C family)